MLDTTRSLFPESKGLSCFANTINLDPAGTRKSFLKRIDPPSSDKAFYAFSRMCTWNMWKIHVHVDKSGRLEIHARIRVPACTDTCNGKGKISAIECAARLRG